MRRRTLLFGSIGLAATTLLAACGSGGEQAATSGAGAKESPEITFLYSPYADYGAFFLAQDKGYFAQMGAKVKLVPKGGSSGETYQLVSAGNVVAGGASWGAGLFNAVKSGASLSVLSSVSRVPKDGRDPSPFMVAVGSGVKKVADLRGKKIGVPGPGGFGAYSVALALKTGGLTLKDVELTNISPPDTGPAMANGAIAAAWTIEPMSTALEEKKIATRLVEHHAAGTELGAVVFNTDFLKKNEDAVVKFLAAYLKAADELASGGWKDPANKAIIAKYTDLPVEMLDRIGLTENDPTGDIDWNSVSLQEQFFREQGDLEYDGNADMQSAFRKDLLDRASASLGSTPAASPSNG
ncbi:ABC transporter substrate-binding protein [Sinosporangium siamense]|uniref:ABC transporter substrate-binding protein n=1 Tax=Sinosporangium siamense TaxID=1367973 RepID=A0A919RRP8_9ACTN|nr:ABC transporter substrate-binding protein [Sinosporangium siamense]GII97029.1 ABC transporter substrate-binding protein [Sinosporangium siamense]